MREIEALKRIAYSGHDTKIMLNSMKARAKSS